MQDEALVLFDCRRDSLIDGEDITGKIGGWLWGVLTATLFWWVFAFFLWLNT